MDQRDEANGAPVRIKVNDRRRFDMEGNVREEEEAGASESGTPPVAPAKVAQGGAVQAGPAADQAELRDLRAELEASRKELDASQEELEASRRRTDELARAYQAAERDREEFKARLRREREQLIDVERGRVALVLLEALDELDRCLAASPEDSSPLAQGVRMIRDAMLQKLQSSGVERLSVVGQPFDPNVAEAADLEVTPNQDEDQRVVAEVQAGYRIKDRVIRPARVKVARFVAPAQA